ncbi:MAG: hypothetical protein JRH20_01285 [Deltaproteobacteria bacterium]|nr:hypothetical protein [Deltaproteobacteria bacterium]
MNKVSPLCSLLLVVFLSPQVRAGGYQLDGDGFRDNKLRMSFTVPEKWTLSRQTGYPSLLAILTRPQSARMSISLATLERRQSMVQLLSENNRALQALGFVLKASQRTERFGHQLWQLDWTSKGQRHRQAYIPRGARVYILTLSSSGQSFTGLVMDFDFVLESLKAQSWSLPEESHVKERSRAGGGGARPGRGSMGGSKPLPEMELPEMELPEMEASESAKSGKHRPHGTEVGDHATTQPTSQSSQPAAQPKKP